MPSLSLNVNPRSGYPIYLQLVQQVQRAVAIGVLKPGDRLPSVKQLANSLVINPSTVARALRELEHLGLVESLPGRGSYVRSDFAARSAQQAAEETFEVTLAAALREARSLGLSRTTVAAILERTRDAFYPETTEVGQ